jgi:hypothetical protein
VVRDTLPQLASGSLGRGVNGSCDDDTLDCPTITVEDSLVERNLDVGIAAFGADLNLAATIIRRTESQENDGQFGYGVLAQCDERQVCSTIFVERCRLDENMGLGILLYGASGAVQSTDIRDTLPLQIDSRLGAGISARCDPALGVCGSFVVTGSRIRSSRESGIIVYGVDTVMESVSVSDTRPTVEGEHRDDYGQGIYALCDDTVGNCPGLQVTNCRVSASTSAGLALIGASGFIEASLVESVAPRPLDDGFGYGVQVDGTDRAERVAFDVRSCRILDASLAGIVYLDAAGTVTRTEVTGGAYAVVASVGSEPNIANDNVLEGTLQGGLFWGNMDPCPAPAPAIPDSDVSQEP